MMKPIYTLLSLASVSVTVGMAKPKAKNVLMFCIDDLRPQLGCYGHSETQSPNIDRLAQKGVIFTNAHCNVPVCGASRASLMTGMRPTPSRFKDAASWAMKDAKGAKSMAQVFKEAGYYTISNGKVFHHQEDLDAESWSEPSWRPKRDHAAYFIPGNDTLKNPRFGWGPWWEAAEMPDDAYFDGIVANKTMDDLSRLKAMKKPFFVACGFYKPHLPFNAPKKYFDIYDPEEVSLAPNRFKPENAPDALKDSAEPSLFYLGDVTYNSEEYHRQSLNGYYACVSFVDSLVGRIMNHLDKLGLSKNTIVVLWGDHGWNLGEHGFWGKHNLMQTTTQIPLIIAAPGFAKGSKAVTMAEFVDLFPTLCELTGLSVDELKNQLDGTSLVPALKKPATIVKPDVFVRFREGDKVVTPRYAFTEYLGAGNKKNEYMLFDHKVDPQENVNFYGNPAYKQVSDSLYSVLLQKKKLAGY